MGREDEPWGKGAIGGVYGEGVGRGEEEEGELTSSIHGGENEGWEEAWGRAAGIWGEGGEERG